MADSDSEHQQPQLQANAGLAFDPTTGAGNPAMAAQAMHQQQHLALIHQVRQAITCDILTLFHLFPEHSFGQINWPLQKPHKPTFAHISCLLPVSRR